jgi:Lon protease-like protein
MAAPVNFGPVLDYLREMEERIMATLTEILAAQAQAEAATAALKQAVTDEHAEVAALLAQMQATLDALAAELAQGGTPEERADLLARIVANVGELQVTLTAVQQIVEPPPAG